MGCGPSSPAKTVEGPPTAASPATKPPLAPKKPNAEQTMLDPSTLPEVQKDSANTVSSTAETQASTGSIPRIATPVRDGREQSPTSKHHKRHSSRGLEGKRRNDSGRSLQDQPVTQEGPARDYKGLPVERTDNERFSHITRLASTILKAECAAVILGMDDRIVLANSEGLDEDDDDWLPDFCAWALSQASGLVTIEDLTQDERTKDLKWVREDPNISFYSGASLHNDKGERLGVFCAMDFDPKPGTAMMCYSLPNLGEMVHREIQAAEQANSAENLLYRAMDTYWDGSVLINTLEGPWMVRYANEAFQKLTGIDRHVVVGKDLRTFVDFPGSVTGEELWKRLAARTKDHTEFEIYPVSPAPPLPQYGLNSVEFDKPRSRPSVPKRLKIIMRPQSDQILKVHGMVPSDKEINGIFFCIFSPLTTTTSRGTASAIMDVVDKLVPFENINMGPIIGKGSFGSVFKAANKERIVAIKVIEFGDIAKIDAKGDPLEASLMLGLKHPNIVETIEHRTQQVQKDETVEHQQKHGSVGSMEGSGSSASKNNNLVMESWLMLEYCDIGTLSDGLEMGLFHEELKGAVKHDRVPKMTVILQTARDIAAGLEHVHGHHILHGDLTAGNVLLASLPAGSTGPRAFTAKVADFGLSRQAIASKVETATYGTVTHMPPELLNEGIVSKAADVYAYGVLLCEVLTRRPVWEGLRHPQIIHAIAVQKKHPELPESAPVPYRELANACMAADPDERPSFTGIIDSLDTMLSMKI